MDFEAFIEAHSQLIETLELSSIMKLFWSHKKLRTTSALLIFEDIVEKKLKDHEILILGVEDLVTYKHILEAYSSLFMLSGASTGFVERLTLRMAEGRGSKAFSKEVKIIEIIGRIFMDERVNVHLRELMKEGSHGYSLKGATFARIMMGVTDEGL